MIHSDKEGPVYTADDWTNLVTEVDRQGGAVLPDPCVGEPLTFKAVSKDGKSSSTETCNCKNLSMAALPYEPAVKAKDLAKVRERGGGLARVCLVCDVAGAWPRFAHVVEQPVRDEPEPDDDE